MTSQVLSRELVTQLAHDKRQTFEFLAPARLYFAAASTSGCKTCKQPVNELPDAIYQAILVSAALKREATSLTGRLLVDYLLIPGQPEPVRRRSI